jgi:hypothetical protein
MIETKNEVFAFLKFVAGIIAVGAFSALCGWIASKFPDDKDDDGPCGVD